MDEQLVSQKLDSLRRCIQRVESRTPTSVEQLRTDIDTQDIIAINLTRAIQMCVDIGAHWLAEHGDDESPKTMSEVFEALAKVGVIDEQLANALRQSVGFRNVVVHSYSAVDLDIVYQICTGQLDQFKQFARAISVLVEQGR